MAQEPKVEDPVRLQRFVEATKALKWEPEATPGSLSELFWALDALAIAEVHYYYNIRASSRVHSGVWRGLGVLFATGGTLFPLLAAADSTHFKDLAAWGYVLLAVAAALFACNAIFGSSTGHIRFVTAQLRLEREITQYRIKWISESSALAGAAPTAEQKAKMFSLLQQYAEALYKVLEEETSGWGEELLTELKNYREQLETQKPK
jgi:SMODS and SLOG-associating 2TM effector domain 2